MAAATILLGGACGGSEAADLSSRPPLKAPAVIDPATNWSGFYVGLNGGYGWGNSSLNTVVTGGFGAPNQALVSQLNTLSLSPKGATGGVQAGYNWQAGQWLLGVEGDVGYFGLRNSRSTAGTFFGGGDFTVSNSITTDWLLTVRPRAGVVLDRALLYVTGGVAVTQINYASSLSNPFFVVDNNARSSTAKAGWTVGAGLELALSNNWSAKAEYLYIDFGSVTMTSVGNNGAVYTQNASLTTSLARGGLNYRFGGPVVAKY
jgi:outer membrane immunogenic protein